MENTKFYDSAHPRHPFLEEMRGLWRYRDLVWLLVWRNLTVRYKRSFLGALWSLMDPLLTMVIMAIVFSALLSRKIPFFPVYLFSGLLMFNFFFQGTQNAIANFEQAGRLLTKVYLPRSAFVIVSITEALVNLLIGIGIMSGLAVIEGLPFAWTWLSLPLALFIGFIAATGVALALAPLSVLYADVKNIYVALLRLVMYLSAIFYQVDMFSGWTRKLIEFNPLYHLVLLLREPVYGHQWPGAESIAYVSLFAIVAWVAGWWLFLRFIDEAILTL